MYEVSVGTVRIVLAWFRLKPLTKGRVKPVPDCCTSPTSYSFYTMTAAAAPDSTCFLLVYENFCPHFHPFRHYTQTQKLPPILTRLPDSCTFYFLLPPYSILTTTSVEVQPCMPQEWVPLTLMSENPKHIPCEIMTATHYWWSTWETEPNGFKPMLNIRDLIKRKNISDKKPDKIWSLL